MLRVLFLAISGSVAGKVYFGLARNGPWANPSMTILVPMGCRQGSLRIVENGL